MDDLSVIDAHFHFWDRASRHPWLAGAGDKDFFLGDYSALQPLPARHGWRTSGFAGQPVHCEAEWDRDDQVGETEWLTQLHAATGWPNALVGHAWLDDPCLRPFSPAIANAAEARYLLQPVTAPRADATFLDGPQPGRPRRRRGYARLADFDLSHDLRVPCWLRRGGGGDRASSRSCRSITWAFRGTVRTMAWPFGATRCGPSRACPGFI